MVLRLLVINEWLFHDLQGDNGPRTQLESARFLEELKRRKDRLVVPTEGRWMEKAMGQMSHNDPRRRTLSKLLQSVLNSQVFSEWHVLQGLSEVSNDLIAITPPEDLYLVQVYLSAEADLLVTTDQPLHDALSRRPEVEISFRDEFLAAYLDDRS